MSEADFQAEVIALCEDLGLIALHLRAPAREGSGWAGWPDLMIIAPGGGLMFRELKMPGKQLRAPQRSWSAVLSGQDFAVWKPFDLHSGRVRAELEELAGQETPDTRPLTAQERLWHALNSQAKETTA